MSLRRDEYGQSPHPQTAVHTETGFRNLGRSVPFQARRVGKSWRSGLLERPSGREDGRAKNGGLPKQTPELTPAFKLLFWPLAV
jgi:hypothetical protein